jgi:hypothetical protein
MKKVFNACLKGIRGILADFWMLPLAILITAKYEQIAKIYQIFPPLTPEKIGKIIPALVLFLLVMFLVRLYFWVQYPGVYNESLMSKRNEIWLKLPSSQQFLYSRIERWVLIIAFVAIITAM